MPGTDVGILVSQLQTIFKEASSGANMNALKPESRALFAEVAKKIIALDAQTMNQRSRLFLSFTRKNMPFVDELQVDGQPWEPLHHCSIVKGTFGNPDYKRAWEALLRSTKECSTNHIEIVFETHESEDQKRFCDYCCIYKRDLGHQPPSRVRNRANPTIRRQLPEELSSVMDELEELNYVFNREVSYHLEFIEEDIDDPRWIWVRLTFRQVVKNLSQYKMPQFYPFHFKPKKRRNLKAMIDGVDVCADLEETERHIRI